MADLKEILESISLPLNLPDDAFVLSVPIIDSVVAHLPAPLQEIINLDSTALQSRHGEQFVMVFPLVNGDKLKLRIEKRAIVEMIANK